MSAEDYLCTQCGHSFNAHSLKSPSDPPTWGWMTCPEEECDCWMTWSFHNEFTPEEVTQKIAQWVTETGQAAR